MADTSGCARRSHQTLAGGCWHADGIVLEEVRTIRRFTAELAEPDIFPKHQASAGTIAVAVPSSGLAV